MMLSEALSVLMLFALSCINTEIVSYNFKGSTASIVLINTRFHNNNNNFIFSNMVDKFNNLN